MHHFLENTQHKNDKNTILSTFNPQFMSKNSYNLQLYIFNKHSLLLFTDIYFGISL